MEGQKQLAANAIKAAAVACRSDPEAFKNGSYQESMKAIDDAERYLLDAIDGRIIGDCPNPAFRNFDLAVAKLALLSVEFGALFDALMINICEGHPFSSYKGFIAIHWFFRMLSDDHSFDLVESYDGAVIKIEDGNQIGPAAFHSYLSKLV